MRRKIGTALFFGCACAQPRQINPFHQESKGSEVKLDLPGLLTGKEHLEKSNLLVALK